MTKFFARFRALKSFFELNVFIGYFGRSQRIITAVPHGSARMLRLTLTPAPSALDLFDHDLMHFDEKMADNPNTNFDIPKKLFMEVFSMGHKNNSHYFEMPFAIRIRTSIQSKQSQKRPFRTMSFKYTS